MKREIYDEISRWKGRIELLKNEAENMETVLKADFKME